MMSRGICLTVVILFAVTILFLNIKWSCLDDFFKLTSYHNVGRLREFKECSTNTLSQELINLSSIQIPKDISSYFSFKQNLSYSQIAKLQVEENYSPWLLFNRQNNKISKAQIYILNSSYLL